jgi:hypothetical protein
MSTLYGMIRSSQRTKSRYYKKDKPLKKGEKTYNQLAAESNEKWYAQNPQFIPRSTDDCTDD